VGNGNAASGAGSFAGGQGATASGDYDIAIGNEDTAASGTNSIAIGLFAVATGYRSVALGAGSAAGYDFSTAIGGYDWLGSAASATTTNQVRLGTAAQTVSIPGVLTISGTQTNTTFTGANTWSGDVATPPLTFASAAAGNNTINATNRIARFTGTPGGAWTIVGITSGRDGRLFTVYNDTGHAVTIANESGVDPTAANRIRTMAGTDYVSGTNAVIQLFYDGTRSRWIMISANP
jgi:hypothetical protein